MGQPGRATRCYCPPARLPNRRPRHPVIFLNLIFGRVCDTMRADVSARPANRARDGAIGRSFHRHDLPTLTGTTLNRKHE